VYEALTVAKAAVMAAFTSAVGVAAGEQEANKTASKLNVKKKRIFSSAEN
jgi:hypothetical protein